MYICEQVQPVSRTLQYRKVMKPLLERKRRARINKCLDELKELMVSALVTDGYNASKLEKADILELTVAHLHKLRRRQSGADPSADRFKAGFTDCANEVSKCLASVPGVDVYLGMKLMSHLGQNLKEIDRAGVGSSFYTPPPSPCPEDFRCCFSTEGSGSTFWRPW